MPGDEYTSVIGGGLKLKGVHGSKVDKHKKKRKKEKKDQKDSEKAQDSPSRNELDEDSGMESKGASKPKDSHKKQEPTDDLSISQTTSSKTEAERRHEEQRRKRLDDRLKREGVKTHKERVEDYNRYLSSLSEHHDMPRIGPG